MEHVQVNLTKEQAVWLTIVAKNASAEGSDGTIRALAKDSSKRIAVAVAEFDAAVESAE
jgi:hypothetical protein